MAAPTNFRETYADLIKEASRRERDRLFASPDRQPGQRASIEEQVENTLRNANRVLSEQPQIKVEDTHTDWEDTFVIIPKTSVYTGDFMWGPAYKRTRTKQKFMYVGGKKLGGMRGGLIERGLGKASKTTEYATGPEIFNENLKRAGNDDIQD